MKKILLSIFTLIIAIQINAQTIINIQNSVEEIKKRELIVVMEMENDDQNKILNTHLREAIKNYWNFSDNYIFVSRENLGNIKDTEFAFMVLTQFKVQNLPNKLFSSEPFNREISLSISLSEKYNLKYPLASVNLKHEIIDNGDESKMILNEKDIIFAVQRLYQDLSNNLKGINFDRLELKNRTTSLSEKTLLIEKELLSRKLGENDFKKLYPFKYEVVDTEYIVNKLKEKSSKHAYLGMTRHNSGKSQSYYVTINECTNGALISRATHYLMGEYELKKKQVKQLIKLANFLSFFITY